MKKIFLSLLLLIAVVGFYAFTKHGGFKSLDPHFAGSCHEVPGIGSVEDLQIDHRAQLAFLSVQDRLGKVQGGSVADGGIVVYDLIAAPSSYNISAVKALSEFNPHGLSLYTDRKGGRRLYVINHRASGQDTVEVFTVTADNQLVYQKTITDPLFESANDIVAIGPDQFYLANDSGASNNIVKAFEMLGFASLSKIVYFDRGDSKVVVEGFAAGSGINASADGNSIYISALFNNSVEVYQRDLLSGALTHTRSIALDMAPDNIDVAPDGSVWVAGHPNMTALVKLFFSKGAKSAPSQVYVIPNDGGVLGEPVDLYTSMGMDISASSVAAEHAGKIYLGSVTDRKILVCEPG